MAFKSKREVYQALLDGKTIVRTIGKAWDSRDWDSSDVNDYLRFNERGDLEDKRGGKRNPSFYEPSTWEISEPDCKEELKAMAATLGTLKDQLVNLSSKL